MFYSSSLFILQKFSSTAFISFTRYYLLQCISTTFVGKELKHLGKKLKHLSIIEGIIKT